MAHTLDGMKADGNVADRREAQGGRRETDRFGLNMRRWAAQHESYIDTALMQGGPRSGFSIGICVNCSGCIMNG